MNKMKQTVIFGGVTYFGGFIADRCWVTDMKGKHVAECFTSAIAKAMAKELNKLFEYGCDLK